MNEVIKSDNNSTEQIKKLFGLGNFVLKNKTYLFFFVFYTVTYLILLYLIIVSTQEIIKSNLINIIITFYFKDKLVALTTLIGLIGAFTILIGYISSENEERIIGKEGKLFLGLTFWHRNFLTKVGILILIIAFTKTYYDTFNLTLSHFRTNRHRLVEFINIVKKLNSLSVSLM